MGKNLGILLTGRIAIGVIEDQNPCSSVYHFPENPEETNSLLDTPLEGLVALVCEQALRVVGECGPIEAVGVALPGIVRDGAVEDSPNLAQLKGARIGERIHYTLSKSGISAPVTVLNDADAIAAGVAAKQDRLDHFIRIWSLGYGIGFGRYPYAEGTWEGGHTVVTLDPGETYCGCGGRGHLEGIMGHRAMRLRFFDLEPHEIFEHARKGDKRCSDFVVLWHRALAAATATQIHLEGPGKFYFTGRDIGRLDLATLQEYLHKMVKMSPLQGYSVEILPEDQDIAVIGAGAAAKSS